MKNIIWILIISLTVLIAGCQAPPSGQVTDIDQIVGTWKSDPFWLAMRIHSDGVVEVDVTANNIEEGSRWEYKFWFEDEQMKFTGFDGCGEKVGTYDMELLENGNLIFNIVEDDCVTRVNAFAGQRTDPIMDVVWLPVE